MIDRKFDDRDGIIKVTGTGIWTIAEVDRHFDQLRRMIATLRDAGRPVRVLSDVTFAERQSPEIEAQIQLQHDRTYRPGDRIAILTHDIDDRNYIRAIVGHAEVAAFSSVLAAEMWLVEDSLARPA
jgi:hypothetical protein